MHFDHVDVFRAYAGLFVGLLGAHGDDIVARFILGAYTEGAGNHGGRHDPDWLAYTQSLDHFLRSDDDRARAVRHPAALLQGEGGGYEP